MKKRSVTKLSERLSTSLEAYALAATVTGAGFLVSAPLAEAQVIYTPVNVSITSPGSFAFDLNRDGIVDFTITEKKSYFGSLLLSNKLYLVPGPGALVALSQSAYGGWVGVIPSGAKIPNPFNPWDHCATCIIWEEGLSTYFGHWQDKSDDYVGLAFVVNRRIHYGWARMSVSFNHNQTLDISATVTGLAYEATPGKPIRAGAVNDPRQDDPGASSKGDSAKTRNPTLGRLAAGAR